MIPQIESRHSGWLRGRTAVHLGLALAIAAAALSTPSAAATQRNADRKKNHKTTVMKLNDRFDVEVTWHTAGDQTGQGVVAHHMTPPEGVDTLDVESEDSVVFSFFGPNNWETLVKVLNGCPLNDHFWVFSAGSTDVAFDLRVTDTWTGTQKDYENPLGVAAPAVTDTNAFSDSCSLTSPPPTLPGDPCIPTDTVSCLGEDGRFRVEINWGDYQNNTGPGTVVTVPSAYPEPYTYFRSEDTGLFYFFDPDNWEMLVKVLDGCGFNDHYWVFAAATTDVEYTLTVTDTTTQETRSYFNPLGQASDAITDTSAFATCPKVGVTGRTRHDRAIEIETKMNRAAAPVRFVLRSDESEPWFWTSCSGFSNGVVGLHGKELVYLPNLGWSGEESGLCVVTNGDDELEVLVHATVN